MKKIKASELFKSFIKNSEVAFMFGSEDYEKEIKVLFRDEGYIAQQKALKASKIQNRYMQISLAKGMLCALDEQDLLDLDVSLDNKYKELAEEAIKETHDYWDQYFK